MSDNAKSSIIGIKLIRGQKNVRHETLLKVIIIAFAIILIILATFVYGNIQRSNQKKSNSNNQNTVQTQTSSEQTKEGTATNDKPAEDKNKSSNQPSTAPAPTPTPTPQSPSQNSTMPATGASDGVIPMTILSVLSYMYIKSKITNKTFSS